ncbi:ferredoxin--NADP reductase [Nocardia mexicana]|uniref:3-ketosteroid 9alpha-monooxygenase subunit B n=1 Tax=Nocardia mexicana TaxID=279262 RepID=A0A370HJ53_9NOCA|nr:ferredoxin--NADP reductase [Nocardia mexicana]RDI55509.1 3-ketosteroid 9alpha-monooxygenase subunit B [Nocardia mexicana]
MRAHEVKVVEVIGETADTVSLVLDIPDDLTGRFAYAPGQFLTVRVPSERTGSVARCYSLSSSPHHDPRPVLTVKRSAGGYASNWLCDNVVAGSVLTVLEPSGSCVPRSLDGDVLLCAGGSGITPVMSIVKSVLYAGRGRAVLLYANRDRGSIIFADRLEELAAEFPGRLTVLHWLESDRGMPSARGLAALAQGHGSGECFACGPPGFLDVARKALACLGIPQHRIRIEEYRSLSENPFEDARPARTDGDPPVRIDRGATGRTLPDADHAVAEVEFEGRTYTFDWPRTKRLLDVLLDHGLDAPYVCRESACGTCVCTVRRGRTRMVAREALLDDEIDAGLTLACQTLPESPHIHIAFDQ